MQAHRTWDGVAYVYEAHSHSRERLEWLRRDIPDGEIRWEPVGLIIPTGPLAGKSSGPCYVLWRPLPGVAAPELEDLADLLGPQPLRQPARPVNRPAAQAPQAPRRPAPPRADDDLDDDDDNIGNRRLPTDQPGNQGHLAERNGNQRYPAERNGNQRHLAERNGNQRHPTERNGNQRYPTERNGNQRYPAERNGNQRGATAPHASFTTRDPAHAAGRRLTDESRQPHAGGRLANPTDLVSADRRHPGADGHVPPALGRPATHEASAPAAPHGATDQAAPARAEATRPNEGSRAPRPVATAAAPEAANPGAEAPARRREPGQTPSSASLRVPPADERPAPPAVDPSPEPPLAPRAHPPEEAAVAPATLQLPQQPEASIAQQLDVPIVERPGSSIVQRMDASEPEEDPSSAKPLRGGPMRKLPKTTPYKGITRIDHPKKNMYGFYVRVGWNLQHRSKFFSDKTFGDRDKALEAALTWRNQTEEELGKPHTELQVVGSSRTPTGVIGVRLHYDKSTPYYEASWRDNEGRTLRTRYSILKHGDQRAFELAVLARERGEQARLLQQDDTQKERASGKRRRRVES